MRIQQNTPQILCCCAYFVQNPTLTRNTELIFCRSSGGRGLGPAPEVRPLTLCPVLHPRLGPHGTRADAATLPPSPAFQSRQSWTCEAARFSLFRGRNRAGPPSPTSEDTRATSPKSSLIFTRVCLNLEWDPLKAGAARPDGIQDPHQSPSRCRDRLSASTSIVIHLFMLPESVCTPRKLLF